MAKKKSAIALISDLKRKTRKTYNSEEKSESLFKACLEKPQSPNYAENKALAKLITTNGVKTS